VSSSVAQVFHRSGAHAALAPSLDTDSAVDRIGSEGEFVSILDRHRDMRLLRHESNVVRMFLDLSGIDKVSHVACSLSMRALMRASRTGESATAPFPHLPGPSDCC
jgi:hypothetical protein